jgi:UDP-N-acetylmuramoylalanine--D-glutamate ligase
MSATPQRGVALVHGIAQSGLALAGELQRRGWSLVVSDDQPTDAKRELAAGLGAELVEAPDTDTLKKLVASVDIVCPAPGVPETHGLFGIASERGVPVRTEIDLAYEWEQQRPGGPRPILAITGTDGKTTTTMLAAHLLNHAGVKAAAVGNTEVPFVAALHDDVDVFVVECSSFRLHFTESFRAEASVWLNLAPDHQNWHRSMSSYEAAKARMWAYNRPTDVAVGFAADPVVMHNLQQVKCRTRTFAATGADYRIESVDDGAPPVLAGPNGAIASVSSLVRDLPHDRTNALAAAALVLEAGLVSIESIADGLATFRHPPHRIEPIGTLRGARWFNDSKATTPHAALTAIRGFERIVLLAGGRNKGLDLTQLASEAARVKAVIGLGEAAAEVVAGFSETCPTFVAVSMRDAVEKAAAIATDGDTVLLSPACASFDWYPGGGYPARGEDFRQCFTAIAAEEGT